VGEEARHADEGQNEKNCDTRCGLMVPNNLINLYLPCIRPFVQFSEIHLKIVWKCWRRQLTRPSRWLTSHSTIVQIVILVQLKLDHPPFLLKYRDGVLHRLLLSQPLSQAAHGRISIHSVPHIPVTVLLSYWQIPAQTNTHP
jgi:hypothetical protein